MALCHHVNVLDRTSCMAWGFVRTRKREDSYLFGTPRALAHVLAVLQPGQDPLYRRLLLPGLLLLKALTTLAGLLLLHLKSLLDKLNILESQLLGNDVEVTGGVDISLNVDDLSVIKAADDLENGIDSTNMRQESVAQASASGRATSQTCDIVDGQVGGDPRLGLKLVAQPVISVIGDDDAGLFRVDGGIGEVGWIAEVALGDGLEEGGFTDVCKADLIESQRRPEIASGRVLEGRASGRLTIPLFRLLPGRPRRIFFSSTAFLGGIFLFFCA